jgi:hypothetical protein
MPPPSTNETKIIHGYVLHRTEKALQFECREVAGISCVTENGDPRKEWFPLSQLTKIHNTRGSDEMDWIECPTWLLRKKEII